MQRRAAAAYAVLFLLTGAVAYSVIGAASPPAVTVDGPRLSAGESITVSGQAYTVSEAAEGQATLAWTDPDSEYTEDWDAHVQRFDVRPGTGQGPGAGAGQGVLIDQDIPTVTVQGTEYRVVVQPAAEPSTFFLVEAIALDENTTTVTRDGATYAVVDAQDGPTLVPIREYVVSTFGEPDVRELTEGDRIEYQNQTVTVARVTNETVTVEWTAPRDDSVRLSEGSEVTLGDVRYVAHFPNPGTVQLTTDIAGYEADLEVIATYEERITGLWGVSILSGMALVLVVGLSYLPSRY